MKILFATGNETKAKRFSKGLSKYGIEVLSLKDINLNISVNEDGHDAIENAIIKAKAYAHKVNIPVLAMDDTLYLEGVPLNKQPGLYVRRVNGKTLNDTEMLDYYTRLVKEYGIDGKLDSKWVYGMSLINEGNIYTYTWNKSGFYLTDKVSDKINPGYPLNSISINTKLGKYFTDMTEIDKELVQEDESHVIDFIVNSLNIK